MFASKLLSCAFSASFLFLSLGAAQQCYYPDGSPSTDTPCVPGGTSSCCGADAFCLQDGLCFGNGVVSRGSCTDESWQSGACTPYCKAASPDSSVALVPCSVNGNTSVFVCGLNTPCGSNTAFVLQGATSFVLRPNQVAALVGPALASATQAAAANSTVMFPLDAMIGVSAGLGVPFLVTLFFAIFMARRQARRQAAAEFLYKSPDGYKSDYALNSPPLPSAGSRPDTSNGTQPSSQHSPLFPSHHASSLYSDNPALRSPMSTLHSRTPPPLGTLHSPTPPPMSGFHSPTPPPMVDLHSSTPPPMSYLHPLTPPPVNMSGYMDQQYIAYKDPSAGSGNAIIPQAVMAGVRPMVVHVRPPPPPRTFELDSVERTAPPVELAARTKSNKSTRSSMQSSRRQRMRPRPPLVPSPGDGGGEQG